MKNRALILCLLSVAGQLFSAANSPEQVAKMVARQRRQEETKKAFKDYKLTDDYKLQECARQKDAQQLKELAQKEKLASRVSQFRAQRQAKKAKKISICVV